MAWKFPGLAWLLPGINPGDLWGGLWRPTLGDCSLFVAGAMLGVWEIWMTLEDFTLNIHGSTKHNLNKSTSGFRLSPSRNSLNCLEGSEVQEQ